MTHEKTLGSKIRSLRTLKGLSQENMADMLGISKTAYSKIEREETDVNMSRLKQVAKELGVSVTDLMEFGEGISNSFNKNKGTNTVICSPDSQDILIELTRLKTENEGLKREMLRLEKIISLLEEKSVLISSV